MTIAKSMPVRQFVRGGYKDSSLTEPVIVVSGDHVAGVWYPGTIALLIQAAPVARAGSGGTNGHGALPTKAQPQASRPAQQQAVPKAAQADRKQRRTPAASRPAKARRGAFPDLTSRA